MSQQKPLIFEATKLHTHSLRCAYCPEIAKYLIHPLSDKTHPVVECVKCLLDE